jgi:CRP-like cAMP-binding protein
MERYPGDTLPTRPDAPDGRPKNQLLAVLPPEDFLRLMPYLTTVPLDCKQLLYKTGDPLRNVYFPNGGVASITTSLWDGTMMEAATVGHEGMLGIETFLTADAAASGDALIHMPDTDAKRMSVHDFRRESAAPGAFRNLIACYTQVVIAQMMQTVACHVTHDSQQRCARWLLMVNDRMHRQEFPLSHETLADMLGVHPSTVKVIVGTLCEAQLIRYARGYITVCDRTGLESQACDCYRIIRRHIDRLRR